MYDGSISNFPTWVQLCITVFVSLSLFEFIIFYIVFIFGLFKSCFKNSLTNKHGSIWLAILAAIIFTFVRALHVPMLLMNIPLPFKFPPWFIKLSLYFVTSIFIILLLSPVFTMIYTKIVSEKRKLTKNDNFKTNSIQRERPVINSTSAHDIINLNFGSNSSLTNTGTSEKGRSNNNLYQSASLNAINRNDDNTSIGPLVKTSSNPYNNEDFSSTSRLNPQNENITQSSTKIDINNSLSSIVLVEPIVCIIMPIYNELLPILLEAIDRIVDSNYDKSKLHLYLSFDDSTESVLYLKLMNSLGALKFRTSAFEGWYFYNYNYIIIIDI